MIHTALILTGMHGLEEIDRFEARPGGDARAVPEILRQCAVLRIFQLQMRSQRVGHAADFPAAHGVGLPCERERPHSRTSDPAGQQVAVDDAVDLVGSGGGLIHSLREGRHDAFVCRE